MDTQFYIHNIYIKMITPEQAIKMHEKKFESRKNEFDKIVNKAIENNFDRNKGMTEVRDRLAVDTYNLFKPEVIRYCQENGRNIKTGTYKEGDMRGDEWDPQMLVLTPKKSNNNFTEIPVVGNGPQNPMDH